MKRRHVRTEEKIQAVLRVLKGETADLVATEMEVSLDRVERWQQRFVDGGRLAMEEHSRKNHSSSRTTLPASFWQWAALLVVLIVIVLALVSFSNS